MKILAVDYGKKNVGLAVSDASRKLAFPYKTLINSEKLFGEINRIIAEESIGIIVIGLPLTKKQGLSPQTKEAENWGEELKKRVKIPVEFENEIFTTKIAERHGVKQRHAAAAAVLLQDYLDRFQGANLLE